MTCSWFSCTMRLCWLLGMLLSGCPSQSLQAQQQPVSATLQIAPPYSVYLPDYTQPGSEQMKLHLLLRDLAEPDYPIRLHLTVEGAGIRIETSPSFIPPPLILQGGVPAILTSTDLAPYLYSRNLLFSGITLQQYEKRGSLPEGFYRFTFRVLDYRRQDIVLSNAATFMAWFVLNDPPHINAPLCGTTLKLADPQTILFQWMPGNAGSPNSILDTEYKFSLVEVRPKGRNPNDAILSSVPLYQITTAYTSLVYGLSEPALIPGQQYAFRVQARDVQGRDLFKNQGYSEVCTFTYGEVDPLEPPEFVHVYADAQRRAQVSWQMSINPDNYRVEYRKQPGKEEEHAWFQKETTSDQVTLYDLEPATTYEVRVASMFQTFASRYTRTQTFTTPERRVIACGQAPAPHLSAETQPLLTAIAGQYWKVGEFEMQLLEVRGGDGIFSGIGSVSIPYLGLQVPVQFEEVKVNQNRELVWGEVVALREDIATFRQRWEEAHPEPSEPIASAEEEKAADEIQAPADPPAATDNISVTGTIAAVQVSETGEILVTDTDGKQTTYAQPQEAGSGEKQETLISDAAGNTYKVDKDGKVSKEAGNGGNDANPSTKDQSDPLLEKEEALIAAVLEEFEERMAAWLEVHGKGPLSEREWRRLANLPKGIRADAILVDYIHSHTLPAVQEDIAAFREEIGKKPESAQKLHALASKVEDLSKPLTYLSQEEQEEVEEIIGTALSEKAVAAYIQTELDDVFGVFSDCSQKGFTEGIRLFWNEERGLFLSTYGGMIKAALCLTEKGKCPSGEYWVQFSYGAMNALVQEVDVVGMAMGIETLSEMQIKNRVECLLHGDEVIITFREGNVEEVFRTINKCYFGVDISKEEIQALSENVKQYIAENWDDPYLHGQATVVILSLVSPTKFTKAAKLKLLNKLKGNKFFASKVDELNILSEAVEEGKDVEKVVDELRGVPKGLDKISKTNLFSVPWKNNIVGHRSTTDAVKFWNNSSKEFKHFVDGDFYIKFDDQTGNLLFGNHKSGELLGFYEGARNIEIVNSKSLNGIFGKLKIYHGVSGSPSYVVSNVSSGAKIIATPDKTATIIGNYIRYPYKSGDMKALVYDELLGDLKTQQFGVKKGGFNVLNVSDEAVTSNGGWSMFWGNFNRPWLEEAIKRGDDIWAASDPMDLQLLFKNLEDIPVEKLNNSQKLAEYLRTLDDPEILKEITGFGKEIKLLSENGYIYDINSKMFVR